MCLIYEIGAYSIECSVLPPGGRWLSGATYQVCTVFDLSRAAMLVASLSGHSRESHYLQSWLRPLEHAGGLMWSTKHSYMGAFNKVFYFVASDLLATTGVTAKHERDEIMF